MVGLKRPMSQISSFSDGPAARRPRNNAPSPSMSLVNNSHTQTWPRNPSPLSQYGSSANTYRQMPAFNNHAYQMAAQMHAQQMSNQSPHQMSIRTTDVDIKDTPFNPVINATTAGARREPGNRRVGSAGLCSRASSFAPALSVYATERCLSPTFLSLTRLSRCQLFHNFQRNTRRPPTQPLFQISSTL
ncbi:uncharacterized protein K452DRAFT_339590 [Aplosporella prunicola CBS 121167]|uniref:Uncharacterized protein n=1 Tax=Aplosporella prunicola CBS 121167 TaxID=1176127 RepID=A0A6A6B2V0_9PEZI|nr:uncharacterized protein K452DRAFT_339590 [Aplosporella prunicola CBS 121167]KAF2137918.1 hypothetical protein K452DRAFT_339590 [Aplosporella prunicola CBS 121167]